MAHSLEPRCAACRGGGRPSTRRPYCLRWLEDRNMKSFPRVSRLLAVALACVLSSMAIAAPKPARAPVPRPVAAPNPYAALTLVVFNETDHDSVELAHFYAEKRGIPKEQVIGLKCAKTEE